LVSGIGIKSDTEARQNESSPRLILIMYFQSACMKDIRKLIRNDSENPDNYVLHLLGEFNIMSTDLIPIVLVNTELTSDVSERLVLACRKLLGYFVSR
jgi:hypothetical protein